ncbi:TlpA family protein disulfide reductase [Carboxylicivirga sp. N1Y90]|uniref:TlpA family protein disulfide reductase n=1 Tax=Carboxylicivirga fragile TaxID=3417571 RepID=UPI003D351134|nr:TlpA family protein disulfide reductase [Marinilabiliaceae bacterium N1Y90]
MKALLPYLISLGFAIIIFSNTALTKWHKNQFFRNYESIDEPIRSILEQDDFLSDEKDAKILVINLWATWCQPCQREIPHLNKLLDKYEQEGVLFLAINGEKKNEVNEWIDLQKHEFSYFQLYEQKPLMKYLFELNPDESFKKGQKPQALPTNLIIKNGELIYYKAGFSKQSIEALEAKLSEILKGENFLNKRF